MNGFRRKLRVGVFLLATFAAAPGCRAEPKVLVVTRDGKEIPFTVEIADTPEKREIGLMYRKEMAADHGMIFIFAQELPQSFWMKNTQLPLDMLFISADQKIVGIVEQATPFSLEPRGVSAPSQFVLEINGGLASRYQIRPGDRVRFEGFSIKSARE